MNSTFKQELIPPRIECNVIIGLGERIIDEELLEIILLIYSGSEIVRVFISD